MLGGKEKKVKNCKCKILLLIQWMCASVSLNVGEGGCFVGRVELIKPGVDAFVRSVDRGHCGAD